MTEQHNIVIEKRFCGPPQSGNGGYVSGVLAALVAGDSQVTLHAPPPLDVALVGKQTDEGAELWHGEQLLASAKPVSLELDVPPMPALDQVAAAEPHYIGFTQHELPGCFVCGTEREAGDALCIYTGPLDDGRVATRWQAPAELADAEGNLTSPMVWAALDCPGFFAVQAQAGHALLGRFSVRQLAPVPVSTPLVVMGWALHHDGRKHQAGTAIYQADGELLAWGHATWISINRS
ncbi:MAG: hypothetical protein EA348_09825 [Pseudomonadaceae bacterium]|nr:MAG: hypothetical protein EA348_09825 [Pseudomonadaceae bacterium]